MTHTRACETAAVVPPHPISLDTLKKQDSSSLSNVHTLMEFLGLKGDEFNDQMRPPAFFTFYNNKIVYKAKLLQLSRPIQ